MCGHIAREVHLRLREAPRENSYVEIVSRVDSLGGSAAFGALALAASGIDVTIFGPRPRDAHADDAAMLFERMGIRWIATARPRTTPVFYSMYAPTCARYVVHEPVITPGSAELPDCDFVVLYPCAAKDAMAVAHRAHNLVLAPSGSLYGHGETFTELCSMASWVLLNEDEARRYATPPSNLIVTCGARGARLIAGGEEVWSRTSPIDGCFDAGAGDVLAAVFAAGVHGRGMGPLEALARAQRVVHRFLSRGDLPLESPRTLALLEQP